MKKLTVALLAAGLLPFSAVQAEQYWSDNSLSLLYGGNYKQIPSGDTEAKVMTLEHASGHSWGDVFLFVDRIQSKDNAYRETYGELSPTFYLKQFKQGPVKSINAEFTYEFGSSTTGTAAGTFSQDNYLAGVGLSWAIPGMDFFKTVIYRAQDNNTYLRRYDNQLTVSYGWHYDNINLDGFIDYTPGRHSDNTELNITPQLTYNIGPLLGLSNKVKVGVEYAYWKNKFRSDETQNNVSFLLKWHL